MAGARGAEAADHQQGAHLPAGPCTDESRRPVTPGTSSSRRIRRNSMPFLEKGKTRIHYEEVGAGFPLMVIPGGGLNSTVAGLANHPFNPLDEFKGEYRVISADLRNANGGQSSGPVEIDRPWDAYADDHIGLMDNLGIREFMVLGFCIG